MRSRFVFLVSGAMAALATSCSAPHVEVRAEPDSARIFVDGREVGTGQARDRLPYYGTMSIDGIPRQRTGPTVTRYGDAHRDLVVDEPFTPWIFPFDFLLEWTTIPVAGVDLYEEKLELPVVERLPQGVLPPGTGGILERSRGMIVER